MTACLNEKINVDAPVEAQLKMITDACDDPYYWGVFIVHGENAII